MKRHARMCAEGQRLAILCHEIVFEKAQMFKDGVYYMKIKDNYVLQEVAKEYLVVPIAEEADRLQGIIRLNESGAFLWKYLESGTDDSSELEEIISKKYSIERHKAFEDVKCFIEQLRSMGCLE